MAIATLISTPRFEPVGCILALKASSANLLPVVDALDATVVPAEVAEVDVVFVVVKPDIIIPRFILLPRKIEKSIPL